VKVNGHRVDFFFDSLGVVVETDGGRYHRTPAQQRAGRMRDHAHTLAALTPLRFTHGQIAHEAGYVEKTLRRLEQRLRAVARRL
jgi:very-short-patch-repair endonuclease